MFLAKTLLKKTQQNRDNDAGFETFAEANEEDWGNSTHVRDLVK